MERNSGPEVIRAAACPRLERAHRAGRVIGPPWDPDLFPLPFLVRLAAAGGHDEAVPHDLDVIHVQCDAFRSPERASKSQQPQRAIACSHRRPMPRDVRSCFAPSSIRSI